MTDIMKKVEAVVFAAGRKVSLEEISRLCKASEEEVKQALVELKKDYEERKSPLLLIEEGDGWKLTVGEKHLPIVQEIVPHTEITKQVLETLAVVAWKQPILQAEVVNIRTNKAYEHISELEDLGFINKIKHGRSYLIKPTGKFFDYFDLPKEQLQEIFKDVKDDEEAQQKLSNLEGGEKPMEESTIMDESGESAFSDEGEQQEEQPAEEPAPEQPAEEPSEEAQQEEETENEEEEEFKPSL
ncbi:SMC-Scp complex subunit ScpB [Nanoarchaeota archaeon]